MSRARILALAAAAALAHTGCFTAWVTTQATGKARAWDEQVREEAVPMAGFSEHLAVILPLGVAVPAVPLAFTCRSEQRGQDAVYHSAFRYGKQWKKGTAIMFLLEGLGATAFYFSSQEDGKAVNIVYAALLGIDAIGTGALFFAPRKEIYRRDVRDVRTPIRGDCPETLTLQIAGDLHPIDAAGRLGELGELALDDWMQAPSGPLLIGFEGRSFELVVGVAERCTWNRHRARLADPGCAYGGPPPQQSVALTIDTTPGTLTRATD